MTRHINGWAKEWLPLITIGNTAIVILTVIVSHFVQWNLLDYRVTQQDKTVVELQQVVRKELPDLVEKRHEQAMSAVREVDKRLSGHIEARKE